MAAPIFIEPGNNERGACLDANFGSAGDCRETIRDRILLVDDEPGVRAFVPSVLDASVML
jgi:hypothetical protein